MRRVPAIVACLLAALVLAPPALADTRSRDLRVATTTKIDTLNPLIGTLAAEYRVWALNYDLLIAFDQKSMQPDTQHSLAASWEHLEGRAHVDVPPAPRPAAGRTASR